MRARWRQAEPSTRLGIALLVVAGLYFGAHVLLYALDLRPPVWP